MSPATTPHSLSSTTAPVTTLTHVTFCSRDPVPQVVEQTLALATAQRTPVRSATVTAPTSSRSGVATPANDATTTPVSVAAVVGAVDSGDVHDSTLPPLCSSTAARTSVGRDGPVPAAAATSSRSARYTSALRLL